MKQASDELKALLATRRFVMADLYTFTFVDGTILRQCSADHAVSNSGITFGAGLLLERTQISWRRGIEVSTADVTVFPKSTDLVRGYSWLRAANIGLLDGMDVLIEKAFAPSWTFPGTTMTGAVHLFSGRQAGLDGGKSTGLTIHVNSDTELLNVKIPRNIYQPGCLYTLFDTGCTLARDDWTINAAVGAGATLSSIPVPSTGKADGYYDQGVLTLDGGLTRRSVKKWANDTATLIVPLYAAPAEGSSVSLIAGCDKLRATCGDKFNNDGNWRAFPFIPAPESSVSL